MLEIDENLLQDIHKRKVSPDDPFQPQKILENGNPAAGASSDKIVADRGDTVHISNEAKAMADSRISSGQTAAETVEQPPNGETPAEQDKITNLMPGQNTLSAESKRGTNVTVTRVQGQTEENNVPDAAPARDAYYMNITRVNGSQINYSFTDNARINENEDGSMYVYFSATNKTHIYDASGNMTEVDGDILSGDNSGDDIFVNTTGSFVDAGDGDDVIINWADDASILGGSGNDTVILGENARRNTVDTGSGNDTVIARDGLTDTNVSLGEGNNTAFIGTINGGSLTTGNGDNTLSFHKANDGASITLGNGNNAIDGYGIYGDSKLSMGNGDNNLNLYDIGNGPDAYRPHLVPVASRPNPVRHMEDHSSINMGNGDNKVNIYGVNAGSSVTLGNGDNQLNIYEMTERGNLTLGDGNNKVSIYETENQSTVNLGNGNNRVSVYETEDQSAITIGDGNNTLTVHSMGDESSVNLGNGNNTVGMHTMSGMSHLGLRNGNNDLSIYALKDRSALELGNGSNDVNIGAMENEATAGLGNGDNIIQLGYLGDKSSLFLGDGNNFVAMNRLSGYANLIAGTGKNAIYTDIGKKTENKQLSILEELQKRRRERAYQMNRELAPGETPYVERTAKDDSWAVAADRDGGGWNIFNSNFSERTGWTSKI